MKEVSKNLNETKSLLKTEIEKHGQTSETLKLTSEELAKNKADYKKESEALVIATSNLEAMTSSFNIE